MIINNTNLVSSILNLVNMNNIGDTKIYNYLMNKMNNHNLVLEFMTDRLGFEKWYVNKLAYNQKYHKQRYLKINSANNI